MKSIWDDMFRSFHLYHVLTWLSLCWTKVLVRARSCSAHICGNISLLLFDPASLSLCSPRYLFQGVLLPLTLLLKSPMMVTSSLSSDAYKSIGLLLTLPVSQVACERSFSALRRIIGRLRSTMTQEHLEAFMLMFVEKAILTKLDNEDIIDAVAAKSKELRRFLLT